MNILLVAALFSLSVIQAAEQAEQKPIGYKSFPPEIRLQVFKNYIEPAQTFLQLNNLIKNFACWDALNYRLIKDKKEPKHEWFVKAIKDQKKEIALIQAQKMLDDLAKLGDITKIDLLKDAPNATFKGDPILIEIILMAASNKKSPARIFMFSSKDKDINFQWYEDLIRLLLMAGADQKKYFGLTPLAWFLNDSELKQKLDVNHIKRMIMLLVEYGADVNAIYKNLSILDIAREQDQPREVVNYLYSLGARSKAYHVWTPHELP